MKSAQISDRHKMHVADTLCNCMEAISYHKPTGKIVIFSGRNGDDLYRTLHELSLELRRLKNRMARLCPEDQLLVLQTHDPLNPYSCAGIINEL